MIKLPRLPVGYEKVPGLFNRYWDQAMNNIETAVNEILILPAIQAAITAAEDAADAANTAASAAQASSDAQTSESSLINSYIDPASFVGDLISCTSAGVVTVATHDRIYGNVAVDPTVSVTGDSFTVSGVVANDIIRVFYNDPTRAGGAVTYVTTVDPVPPLVQSGSTHSVGAVKVPAAGTSAGDYIRPPGYIDGNNLP